MANCAIGEGQHKLVPRRPDPIGANATLQYAVLGSTALAATYTAFASAHRRRVAPAHSISRTALFVRSSARLGWWAGAAGAALNWYYHSAFVGVVASEMNVEFKPWKLYEWTETRTVEDGCLAGAALGLAASIPTLFMRRPAIPRWTRCAGMTNIGACAGILGAHGYYQYTGERQKAYTCLQPALKRRSLEFFAIFWNKELMACFSPLVQQYVRHNGLWYTSQLPDQVYDNLDDYGKRTFSDKSTKNDADTSVKPQEYAAHYFQPFDYAQNLLDIELVPTREAMLQFESEKQALLKDADYILSISTQRQYEVCRLKDMDEEEILRRRRELVVLEAIYHKLCVAARALEDKLIIWELALQHKSIFEAHAADTDKLEHWLPKDSLLPDRESHEPTAVMQIMEKLRTQLNSDVESFETWSKHTGQDQRKRERWRKDAEDGRWMLKAVDGIEWDIEKRKKALQEGAKKVEVNEEQKTTTSTIAVSGVTTTGQTDAAQYKATSATEAKDKSDGKTSDAGSANAIKVNTDNAAKPLEPDDKP